MGLSFKRKQRFLREQSQQYGEDFALIPREQWPAVMPDRLETAWRNRHFLVQVFREKDHIVRLTVCRTEIQGNGRWREDISWDDLQGVKRALGYGDAYAVEVYPRERDLINVASMRHLWVLPEPLNVGWFRELEAPKGKG